MGVATIRLKTWVNAWVTSRRMHEETQLDCLFGCRGCTDTTAQYLQCRRLWRSVLWSRGASFLHASLLERACLAHPTRAQANDLVVAFRIYHDLKLSRLECVLSFLEASDVRGLASLVKRIASAARQAIG